MTIGLRTMSHIVLDLRSSGSDHRLVDTDENTASRHSSSLEKVLEHRLLAELVTALWIDGTSDFEILRGEVDAHGYDIVIEARGIIRHIQLKAMVRGGRRRDVSVNLRLARKPSGCVIWMVYDPATLKLGPFLWFGAAPGQPLPMLGEQAAKHSKANASGLKLARPAHRLLSKSRFKVLDDVRTLASALFGAAENELTSRTAALAEHQTQLALLHRHLGVQPELGGPDWLRSVRAGRFDEITENLVWDSSVEFAHLIDGYALAGELGEGDPFAFAQRQLEHATEVGEWRGGPATLWASLFLEHRRWRMAPIEPPESSRKLLNRLCLTLRHSLSPEETG